MKNRKEEIKILYFNYTAKSLFELWPSSFVVALKYLKTWQHGITSPLKNPCATHDDVLPPSDSLAQLVERRSRDFLDGQWIFHWLSFIDVVVQWLNYSQNKYGLLHWAHALHLPPQPQVKTNIEPLLTAFLVSMSSCRSAHDSLSWSFHSAIVAASVWPSSMRLSAVALTRATRSVPILRVSPANSWNRSWSICVDDGHGGREI